MRFRYYACIFFLFKAAAYGTSTEDGEIIFTKAPEFHSLVSNETEGGIDRFEYAIPDATVDDSPADVSEEVMDIGGLQGLVYEFTNFTSGGFNVTQILTRLSSLEANVQKSKLKLEASLQTKSHKLRQLSHLFSQILEIKAKLIEFEKKLEGLSAGVENLGRVTLESGDFLPPFASSSVARQTSWATIYRSSGHTGRTTQLDFRNCGVDEDCCLNLQDLDNDAQSINTHGTCVRMYKDKGCHGESREFYAGSRVCHADFGNFRDTFSSGKPCTTTGSYTQCVPD